MITLAVHTGVSAEQWAKEGARSIATALEVLAERYGVSRQQATEDANGVRFDGTRYSG